MKRYRLTDLLAGPCDRSIPHVLDLRIADVPATIDAAIRNAPGAVKAISLRDSGGPGMRHVAEQAAVARGVKLVWFRMRNQS